MKNNYFSEWMPRFLNHLRMRNYSQRTIETYRGVIRTFAHYVWLRKHANPEKLVIYWKDLSKARLDVSVDVLPVIVNDYLSFINSLKTYRARTLRRILSTLSSFYRYLNMQGVIATNPIATVERPRLREEGLVYLKHDQVVSLINSIEDPRDRLVVRLIYATGVRVSELCSIDVEDIDFEEQTIRIRGKGGKFRIVFVDSETLSEIRSYLQGRGSGPLFFGQNKKHISRRTVQYIFSKYAPKGITPHKIRHSYASELYRRSKNLRVLQENLGHSSIKTTEIYLHTDLEERRRIYQEFFPLAKNNENEGKEKEPVKNDS